MGPLPSPQPHASNVPPPPGLPAGTRLGRYEVVSELGTGGMATVYLGRALAAGGFQRLVAIKVLHPHLLRDEQFVQMFLDEGRLAARIHHPNVVATVDLEHTAHGLYIVSEYIEGDILLGLYKNARALEKRIPFGVTLRIVLDALAGLHAAHELADDLGNPLKIIHRDISPHNILVGSDGIARITDFGIAKAEERISTTRDGIVKGKLSYMAPEQPNDLPIDRRVDIFSAATVLWECLTGRRLFPGKTDGEVLQALLHKPISRLREVDPTLSPALDAVLAKALARDPDARYDTAADFADALEAAAGPAGVANSRAVAQYVKEVASAKITAEHERRRLTTRDLPLFRGAPSQVRPIERGSVPPPGPTSDRPPEPPRATPSQPSIPTRLPPLPATHMAPPPPPPPADARISTPPLEPSAYAASAAPLPPPPAAPPATPASATPALATPSLAEGLELPSETIPSLVPPPPELVAAPASSARAAQNASDEAPTQLQSLGHTPATGTRAPPPSPPPLPGRLSRPAMPPFPRATPSSPSAPLPPLPHVGVRTSVVASVPPPPPNTPSEPQTGPLPSFAADPAEAAEDTFLGLAPPAPSPPAPSPPAPSPSVPSPSVPAASATPTSPADAPADAPADTAFDLSLAATTAMKSIAPAASESTPEATPETASGLSPAPTPGARLLADDDDAAPTLIAVPAPPGFVRPSRTPAVPAPPIPGPAASAPSLSKPAVEAPYQLQFGPSAASTAVSAPPRRASVAAAGPPVEGRRRSVLIAAVVALGIVLGYGIWAFTDPHNLPEAATPTAAPVTVYPSVRTGPATPPPMAEPAPAPVAAEAPAPTPAPAPAPARAPVPTAAAGAPRPAGPTGPTTGAPVARRPVPAAAAAPPAPAALAPSVPPPLPEPVPVAPAPPVLPAAPAAPVAPPSGPSLPTSI